MKKLFEKDQTVFAVILIVIYIAGANIAAVISDAVGIEYSGEMIFNAALAVFLYLFAKKCGLLSYIGIKKPEAPAVKMLFYIPLPLIALRAAFFGVSLEMTVPLACRTVMMLCVGFSEEVIFRGFLFKGIAQKSVKQAIVISALTFGIGHIVNLFTGYTVFDSVTQIVYAVGVGFMLVFIYVRTNSIIPCIAFHSLNNMAAGYANASVLSEALGERTADLALLAAGLVIIACYTLYIVKLVPKREVVLKA